MMLLLLSLCQWWFCYKKKKGELHYYSMLRKSPPRPSSRWLLRLSLSSQHQQGREPAAFTKICVAASVLLKVNTICPFFAVLRKSFNTHRLVSTQASDNEREEVKDEVFHQLISAVETNPASIRETCATYVEKLCRSGSLSDVSRWLRTLHNKHIFLRPNTYNIVMVEAGERKDIQLLSQIFKDLLLSCNILGKNAYSSLAKAFLNVDDSAQLLKFVGEVSELIFPKSPNVINRIIFGFGESGQIHKALMIFNHMKSLKCKPDVVTYNTVLDVLGQIGRVDEMLHEFESMKEANIAPDIITYNTLINSLRKIRRLDLCLVLLQEMRDNGLSPDLQTYTAVIDGLGRLGRVEEALTLFGEMKRRSILPSAYIYRALISNLKKVGKLELAISLLEEMSACVTDIQSPRDFNQKPGWEMKSSTLNDVYSQKHIADEGIEYHKCSLET